MEGLGGLLQLLLHQALSPKVGGGLGEAPRPQPAHQAVGIPQTDQAGPHRRHPKKGDAQYLQRRDGRQTGAHQGQRPHPPGGGRDMPPGRHRGQRPGKGPAGGGGEGGLQQEVQPLQPLPVPLAADDQPGDGVEQSGHQRHGPGAAEHLPVVEGEVDGKGEHSGGGVPQAGGEIQRRQRPEAGPHQRRAAVQPGASRPHKGRAEGCAPL